MENSTYFLLLNITIHFKMQLKVLLLVDASFTRAEERINSPASFYLVLYHEDHNDPPLHPDIYSHRGGAFLTWHPSPNYLGTNFGHGGMGGRFLKKMRFRKG